MRGTIRARPRDPYARSEARALDRDGIDVAVLSLQPSLGLEPARAGRVLALEDAWVDGMRELVAREPGALRRALAPRGSRGLRRRVGRSVRSLELDRSPPSSTPQPRRRRPVRAPGRGGAAVPPGRSGGSGSTATRRRCRPAYLAWLAVGRERWPTLRVVFAILAGGGPFQLERLAHRGVDVRSALDPNIFFDISSHGRRAIELCIETFGVGQLVYGSDMPVVDPRPTLEAVRGFGDAVTHVLQNGHTGGVVAMSEIADWLRDRVPADTDLDRPTMSQLAPRSLGRSTLWRPYVRHDAEAGSTGSSTATRTSTSGSSAGSTGRAPATTTTTARRARSASATGTLLEDWFRVEEDGWVRERTTEPRGRWQLRLRRADIHGVRHPGDGAAGNVDPPLLARRCGAWVTTSRARAACAGRA